MYSSSSRRIILLPGSFRIDGRRSNEIRKFKCEFGVSPSADGSVLVNNGASQIIVSVYGPHQNVRRKKKDKATINCEFEAAPFAGSKSKMALIGDRRIQEMTSILRQTFEAAILTDLYPGSQIDIFFLVLYADGGILSSCINAGTLAVINAGIPMIDFLCACSAGFVEKTPLKEINYDEAKAGRIELNLAILKKSEVIVCDELIGRIHRDHINKLREIAIQGCKDIHAILDAIVRKHAALNQPW